MQKMPGRFRGPLLFLTLAIALPFLLVAVYSLCAQALRSADISEREFAGFMRAVTTESFAAAARHGEQLFQTGRKLAVPEDRLAPYLTTSFPPNRVYVLHVENASDAVRRVLLTLDGDNRVVSFLAEEMRVVSGAPGVDRLPVQYCLSTPDIRPDPGCGKRQCNLAA